MGAAWIAAVAAVLVAVIGVTGNLVLRRRAPQDDLSVIRALGSALQAETDRRVEAERLLAACEAREQVREGDGPD